MNDVLLELAKWAVPLVAGWLLSKLPFVKSWARAHWTKSIIIMTALASFSIMGAGFYLYYYIFKPYIILCAEANACVSVAKSELTQIRDHSNQTVHELGLIWNDPHRDWPDHKDGHIREGNKLANFTNEDINTLYGKLMK